MSKPVTVPNTFASQVGNVPASQLDDDYAALAAAINDTATYGNYFLDTGAVNTIAVATPAKITFTYSPGAWLDVLIANTNTANNVTLNVNGVGNVPVVTQAGAVVPVGALAAGSLYRMVYDGTSFRFSTVTLAFPSSYAVDTGAVNVMVAATGNNSFAYTAGEWLDLLVANTNTNTAVSLNVNTLGSKPVLAASGTALAVGALVAGTLYRFVYDGTQFRVSGGASTTPFTSSGTFVGTLTGCTTSPTATFNWTRNGNVVTLYVTATLVGTSNSNTCTITGLPAAIQPASGLRLGTCLLQNNSAAYIGRWSIAAGSGVITLYGSPALTYDAGFTASNQKGLIDFNYTYSLV